MMAFAWSPFCVASSSERRNLSSRQYRAAKTLDEDEFTCMVYDRASCVAVGACVVLNWQKFNFIEGYIDMAKIRPVPKFSVRIPQTCITWSHNFQVKRTSLLCP